MACNHERRKNILEAENFFLSECLLCGLIFLKDKKSDDASVKVYPHTKEMYLNGTIHEAKNFGVGVYENYYKEGTGKRFGDAVESVVKAFRFLRAIKILFLIPRGKKILDIGSGRGWMLYFLKKYFKYEPAIGTQISENAYKFSKEKLGLEVYNKDLINLDLGNKKFDIITLWHVLEHVPDPEAYVQKIAELLEDDGVVLVEVPNYNSWSRMLSKNSWLAMDPNHHITFFTPNSLKKLLKNYGFRIKRINTFSLEYSPFTSAQSLLNLVAVTDNYFFESLQKGKISFTMFLHSALFALLFPVCLVINLMLYFSEKGEIINIIAKKDAR